MPCGIVIFLAFARSYIIFAFKLREAQYNSAEAEYSFIEGDIAANAAVILSLRYSYILRQAAKLYYIRPSTRPKDEYHCEAISLDQRSNITRSKGTNITEKSTLERGFFWCGKRDVISCRGGKRSYAFCADSPTRQGF